MYFFPPYGQWKLDIVGIVAILGEGSISRNAQASGCSWFHILPRLMPAPQALLKHHQDRRLPTAPGIIVGAYSGRVKNELNFFTQLLHSRELEDFEVELVEVARTKGKEHKDPYSVKRYGHLAALSIFGCCTSLLLIALAAWQKDGSALLATIFLSFTSTFVGLASKWDLDWGTDKVNKDRKEKLPDGDVVIFYPKTGSFRIVRCDEEVARKYFNDERCDHLFTDTFYRFTALISTILLMAGLIFMSNSEEFMQPVFALAYVILNALYWLSSARDPAKHVWKHNYDVNKYGNSVPFERGRTSISNGTLKFSQPADPCGTVVSEQDGFELKDLMARVISPAKLQKRVATNSVTLRGDEQVTKADNNQNKSNTKTTQAMNIMLRRRRTDQEKPSKVRRKHGNMTYALWTAIALTGTTQWARSAHIAPDHECWDKWLAKAGKKAAPKWSEQNQVFVSPAKMYKLEDGDECIVLPSFDHQGELKKLFAEFHSSRKRRPIHQEITAETWGPLPLTTWAIARLTLAHQKAKKRLELAEEERRKEGNRQQKVTFLSGQQPSATVKSI